MSTIEPNELARGHNPDRLTNAQVGVPEWRLLGEDELVSAPALSVDIQVFGRIWLPGPWQGDMDETEYRTKLSRAEPRAARGLEPEPESEVKPCSQSQSDETESGASNAAPTFDPKGAATRAESQKLRALVGELVTSLQIALSGIRIQHDPVSNDWQCTINRCEAALAKAKEAL